MRPGSFIALALSAVLLSLAGAVADSTEPELVIQATFPESNPFHHVVNGEKNEIFLEVENRGDREVILQSASGSFLHPETGIVLKNTTALAYGVLLAEGSKTRLPYTFYSEFKPGELRLNIWLDHTVEDERFRVIAYDSIVTVVEPEISWFDYKLISTYLVLIAAFAGGSYYTYVAYFPAPKSKKPQPPRQEKVVTAATGSATGTYEEEWIPEHHLKKTRARKTVVTSGEEVSTGETSGAEGRKKRGKGKKQ